jgi:hypothetical protein
VEALPLGGDIHSSTGGLDPGVHRPRLYPGPPDSTWHVTVGAVVLLFSLLPFIIVTVIRRIAMGRWRFGPRW